jgi:3-hydroxyacyl-[acyl-carrier-protein] dehydratase
MTDLLNQALARLPHGAEFRFLDRLTRLEPGQSGKGEYQVRGDEHFLRGHFPGDPIMPGVLLIEAAAQLVGVVAQSDSNTPPLPGLKLTALKSAKIYGTAKPGETIKLVARITGRLGQLVQAQASAEVNGATVLTMELTLTGAPLTGAEHLPKLVS